MVEETRGRPRININPNDLAALTSGRRVTRIHLAELYGCHPRTIRRRLLEFGLSEPGPPVFTTERLRVRLNLSGQLQDWDWDWDYSLIMMLGWTPLDTMDYLPRARDDLPC